MSKKKDKEREEEKKEENPAAKFGTIVKQQVLEQLGKPVNFVKITAWNVYEDRFRVNVWNTKNPGSIFSRPQIVDSFFIRANEEGIMSSSPVIEKKYESVTPTAKVEVEVGEDEVAPAIRVKEEGPVAQG